MITEVNECCKINCLLNTGKHEDTVKMDDYKCRLRQIIINDDGKCTSLKLLEFKLDERKKKEKNDSMFSEGLDDKEQ